MDHTGLVKTLDLPPGFTPPRELTYEDIRASALTRDDLDGDVRGINASRSDSPHPGRVADSSGHLRPRGGRLCADRAPPGQQSHPSAD